MSTEGKCYPTPSTIGLNGGSNSRKSARARGAYVENMRGGVKKWLNPDWEEWLMGWPIGWTDVNREPEDGFRQLDEEPADICALTTISENRTARVKAIGNGQVPLCAAIMFEYGLAMLEE